MELINYLITGFAVALQPLNLFYCFIGVLIGTLVGVLPGLGPLAAMALLLPATFHTTPVASIIMLSGIYYGAMYGGSTTSILVNIPGEAASVMTCLDGYQMARQGRAGPALGISAMGSFIAGTIGVIGLMLISPPLVDVALKFGPAEYFSLMVLGGVFMLQFVSEMITNWLPDLKGWVRRGKLSAKFIELYAFFRRAIEAETGYGTYSISKQFRRSR